MENVTGIVLLVFFGLSIFNKKEQAFYKILEILMDCRGINFILVGTK